MVFWFPVKPPIPPLGREPLGDGNPSELDLVRRICATGEPGLTLAEFVVAAWHVVEPATPLVWNWHMQVMCDHIQAVLEHGKFGKWAQNLAINVPPGTSKPVSVESRINTRRGLVRMKEVKVGDEVLTHKGRFRRVSAVHEQGVLPLLEVRTARGRAVRAASDHPFLTARGWEEAGKLTGSDVLVAVRSDGTFSPDPVAKIAPAGTGECQCLTVEEDESFTVEDLAVHNSTLASVCAPAWVWTWDPGRRFLCASANPDVALRDSVKCRELITSDWYVDTFQPNWRLADDQNAKGSYKNTRGGFRQAKGVETKITGNRADDILIDDPLDAREAHSKAARDGVNIDWWDQAAANRLNDMRKGSRILIMQRLHEEDLTGHVLETGDWEHLCIPMEFEEVKGCHCVTCERGTTFLGWKDPRKKEGELLFPERFPKDVLFGNKWPLETGGELRRLGEMGYAGQMQQRPTSAKGNIFKREKWRFWSRDGRLWPRPRGATDGAPWIVPPGTLIPMMIQSWDCSFKELRDSDLVCGGVLGRMGGKIFVLDLFWERAGFLKTVTAVKKMRDLWPRAVSIGIEDKANGSAVIETLKGEIMGVKAIVPEGGKEARAAAAVPLVDAGDVYLPEGAPWLERWFEEFSAFPRSNHDDAVDMLSQGLRMLATGTDAMRAAVLLGMKV